MVVSFIALAVILGGALVGMALPGHHLTEDTKDVVRLGTGLVGTIAALVLGLLIASAKSSYDTQNGQVRQITADIILVDLLLAQYGSEAHTARDLLRRAVGPLVERIWHEASSQSAKDGPFESSRAAEVAYAAIQELSPQTDAQRALKARALQISTDLAQTRLLLFTQADNSMPMPFLAVLVLWLTIIFNSFGLFSRINPTAVAVLFVCALSASGAIFLILELSQPFEGVMQISSAPLRNALAPLGP
jgi:Protein of unknown function (DUF4239)